MTTTIASNSAYWNKRTAAERKWIAENLTNDEAFNARIQEYFDKSLTGIQKNIDSEFAKYAAYSNDSMSGSRRAVMAEDVKAYQSEAKQIVEDAQKLYKKKGSPLTYADFSKDVNDRLKLYNATMRINRLEMLKSEIGQEMLDAHMKVNADLISKLSNDYQSEIKRQAGILGETVSKGGYTDLVKLLSQREGDYTFSQRIWINQDILKAKLDELLTAATIQGQSPLKIARKLRDQVAETVNNSRYVTERIARTESARIQTQAQLDSFHKFGYGWCKWVAEPRACDVCKVISESGEGGKGIYKVDDVPDIPVHPNCRCSIAAYVDESNDQVSVIKAKMSEINLSSASKDDIIGLGKQANSACHFDKIIGDKDKLKAAFAQFREMGGQVDKETWYPRSSLMVKEQLQTSFSYYPKKWADYLKQNNKRLFAGTTDRGFFVPDLVNSDLSNFLRGAHIGDGVSIYSSGSRKTTAYHEIGHMVDHFNPDLVRIEKEFVASRTKGEDATRLKDIFPGFGYNIQEITKKDDFISPYIGKEYEDSTEVLSIGLESIFEPEKGQLKSVTNGKYIYKSITDDKDYFNLIIGLILKG